MAQARAGGGFAPTVVVSDGGLPSLVALAMAWEEALVAGLDADAARGLIRVWGLPSLAGDFADAAAHASAVRRHAAHWGLGVVEPFGDGAIDALTEAGSEREATLLLLAGLATCRLGAERLVWPVSSGAGDSVDVDRLGQVVQRSLCAARLVVVGSEHPAVLRFAIHTPLADLSDDQLADLALDMSVPLELCWWWGQAAGGGGAAAGRGQRWKAALARAGGGGVVSG